MDISYHSSMSEFGYDTWPKEATRELEAVMHGED
jgi:hypothetical protein